MRSHAPDQARFRGSWSPAPGYRDDVSLACPVVGSRIKSFTVPIMLVTEQGTCIVQGPRMCDAEALSQMRMPDYETSLRS
ncbi:hypothetical protein [Streptomyces sp. NPDC056937]|uniref:hypothetical protein n=1 Tax=Streptomyces sp. NPDC056937 TaxID=3345969 RepID=UPI00363B50E9